MEFKRITKWEARKRFNSGMPIYLCPCNLRPGFPWNPSCLVMGKEYLEKAEGYRNHPELWDGTVVDTAWNLMYANWSFYNVDNGEMGRYAHYYVEGK